ncbi:hypothetical protein [Streptomyces sp. ok210]|uniref:hypothetical protein n=1 Tax=Streptomyces sp. ok210 TaxID=1761905 RepID=UPI0008EE5838|nr:hypothetical protein [Streptomyces sp. ok210]SFT22164.1 hypothetical protein SAMN04487982_110168 [Streptomyces sp. ok210]
MARKQVDPADRCAREAARRAAATQRIGPRPKKTPRPRQPKLLYDLDPPGVFYKEWDHPVGTDADVMAKVGEHFGPESGEAATMQALLRYREIYGPHIPLGAAGQLDLILTESDLAAQLAPNTGCTEDEAHDSVHSLHAHGMLLIADDGSLWLTVPPGTPYSAPNGEWAFVEKKAKAPTELTDTLG